MKFVRPVTISDTMLISSTVAETDNPEWSSGTTYSLNDVVRRTVPGTHRRYQCLLGNSGAAPEINSSGTSPKWLDIGPTNRWGMFDSQVGTATTTPGSVTVVLQPGSIDALGLLQLTGDSVRVSMTSGGTTVYDRTFSLVYGAPVVDWYAYFFDPINKKSDLVITDLPPYNSGILTITITAASGNVSCGMCVMGQAFDIGNTQYGATIGIIDYSKKDIDAFGNPSITKRKFVKKMDAKVMLDASKMDLAVSTLATWRSTPVLWIGADNLYTSLIIFGFYRDFSVDIAYPTTTLCSLTVEGII
ncbi:hypothetical protein [Undibacterium sp. Ji49W]|uniref:hypothetical protein n=1 Tax=Undibacterium sp. Ji49W TaxID=3413040 RepID=UPI003BF12824